MSTTNLDTTHVDRSGRGIFQTDIIHSRGARLALAGLRLVLGWTFLWAFVDKLFGLGFATPSARAWIHGGTPAQGFMKGATGPFAEVFHSLARTFGAANDWLFMLGLLGIGVALIAGCGLKLAAWTGTLLLFLMYLAEFPLGDHGPDATFTNPITDSHWIEALGLIVVAATLAGDTLGLGRWWGRRVGRGLLR